MSSLSWNWVNLIWRASWKPFLTQSYLRNILRLFCITCSAPLTLSILPTSFIGISNHQMSLWTPTVTSKSVISVLLAVFQSNPTPTRRWRNIERSIQHISSKQIVWVNESPFKMHSRIIWLHTLRKLKMKEPRRIARREIFLEQWCPGGIVLLRLHSSTQPTTRVLTSGVSVAFWVSWCLVRHLTSARKAISQRKEYYSLEAHATL